MTLAEAANFALRENIPYGAVFDALPGDTPAPPGPDGENKHRFIIEPVLTWRVEDQDPSPGDTRPESGCGGSRRFTGAVDLWWGGR
jgi:hypothetical protein